MPTVRVAPVPSLAGTVRVPTDKSITHRAILFGALSDGPVEIHDGLDSEDTAATLAAMEACGVGVDGHLGGPMTVHGVGLRGLRPPGAVDCMNAGTLMRLLAGVLAGQDAVTTLDGDASLRRRPMARVAVPLRAMGARITTAPGGTPPLTVAGGAPLVGTRHDLPVASAQVKSALLLAGLYADGETWVSEPVRSRDHTERMLEAAGVPILRDGEAIGVRGPVAGMRLPSLTVPGDFSSAAFLLVAGALIAGPEVRLQGVNLNPTRTGLLDVMRRMGADVDVVERPSAAGEPYGDLVVRRSRLRATEVRPDEIPALVDEVTLVGLLGAFAEGTTLVRGAGELRVKESDRLATATAALRSVGADIAETADGFVVHGTGGLRGGSIAAAGDHRIAMLGAVAGLASGSGVSVDGFEVAAVSYPSFAADLAALGGAA